MSQPIQTAPTPHAAPSGLAPSRVRPERNWQYRNFVPLLPGMLFLLAIAIYPTIYSLGVSLFRWNLTDPVGMEFGGWHNYALLLSDDSFWHSVFITAVFVAVSVALELALGLGVALLFFRRFPGDKFMRALILLPMVVAPVVVGLLWRYMLNVNFGIINYLLSQLGIPRIDFLGDPLGPCQP
jgi:multiple sugar transport system permease protein